MKYYLMLPIFFAAASLSAASYELDLQELLPQQTIFHKLTVEGELLQVETEQSDDFLEVSLSGPEVEFRLTTMQGEEWSVPLGTFQLHVLTEKQAEHSRALFDLEATSLLPSPGKLNFSKGPHKLIGSLYKALMSLKGPMHLTLEASSDVALKESLLKLDLMKGSQQLHLTMDDSPTGNHASWNLQSSLFGKGALIDFLINALKEWSDKVQESAPESPTEEILQNICAQISAFMDLAAPLLEWDGIILALDGESSYQNQPDFYELYLKNDFKVSTVTEDWSAFMGSRSHFIAGVDLPYKWNQEFVITNLSSDIERLCAWIQVNAIDQLAEYLDMPSLKYYGSYFPKYFNQALAAIIMKLGEPQEDGTLLLAFSGGAADPSSFGSIDLAETGDLLVNAIKEKVNGFWGN